MAFHHQNIWIIGASSGIGEALARELSAQGATLILSARREQELAALNEELGGRHEVMPLDIADYEQVSGAAQAISIKLGTIHRVIVLAAIYRPNDIDQLDIAFATQQVHTNIMGVINASYAILPIFESQQSGQIVLCGSVAGYMGLPGGQPYCATKAAVNSFAESLYAEVADNIDVKLLCPGFVRTRMTDKNNFHMPMRLEPPQAAKAIAKGLNQRGFEIHFPKVFTFGMKFLRFLPYALSLRITKAMNGKA